MRCASSIWGCIKFPATHIYTIIRQLTSAPIKVEQKFNLPIIVRAKYTFLPSASPNLTLSYPFKPPPTRPAVHVCFKMIRFYKVVQVFNSIIHSFPSCSHSLILPAFCALDVICSIRYFVILFLRVLSSIYFLPIFTKCTCTVHERFVISTNLASLRINGFACTARAARVHSNNNFLPTQLRCSIKILYEIHNSPSV